MNNVDLDKKLIGSIEGEFHVPAYQRGFRWREEVKTLLEDIDAIKEGDENYCLQPVVVKSIGKENENKYELIDGQQRLTTIFLIYRYFLPENKIKFFIDYDIRKDSYEFLKAIDFDKIANIRKEHIDDYYFIWAAEKINEWFNEKDDKARAFEEIITKFENKVFIIWYKVDFGENGAALFQRLNKWRIPLTSAELVKALLLRKSSEDKIEERIQLEIAKEWDLIEKELYDDSFWYFITNDKTDNYPARIGLIFDLMADKPRKERKVYSTFGYFDRELTNSADKQEIWTKIKRFYQRLKGWYEDINLYHKIGYLIASESKSLQELIDESSKDITKTKFLKSLDKQIADSIDFDYSELSYENDTDNIEKILLLFNVETTRRKSDEITRFPFGKYKKIDWSLEHIHARRSKSLKKKHWQEWLELHIESLKYIDEEKYNGLIPKITSAIDEIKKDTLTKEKFTELSDEVTSCFSKVESTEYIHFLSNLALLGLSDNPVLSNSAFDVKRDKIIDMDKERYIPVCTMQVFLKYYTPSEKTQLHSWSKDDRDGYIREMDKVLRDYLSIIKRKIKI